jgi:hypothetical protein
MSGTFGTFGRRSHQSWYFLNALQPPPGRVLHTQQTTRTRWSEILGPNVPSKQCSIYVMQPTAKLLAVPDSYPEVHKAMITSFRWYLSRVDPCEHMATLQGCFSHATSLRIADSIHDSCLRSTPDTSHLEVQVAIPSTTHRPRVFSGRPVQPAKVVRAPAYNAAALQQRKSSS